MNQLANSLEQVRDIAVDHHLYTEHGRGSPHKATEESFPISEPTILDVTSFTVISMMAHPLMLMTENEIRARQSRACKLG